MGYGIYGIRNIRDTGYGIYGIRDIRDTGLEYGIWIPGWDRYILDPEDGRYEILNGISWILETV